MTSNRIIFFSDNFFEDVDLSSSICKHIKETIATEMTTSDCTSDGIVEENHHVATASADDVRCKCSIS